MGKEKMSKMGRKVLRTDNVVKSRGTLEPVETGFSEAFKLLAGKWSNIPGLVGRGWNMIALPFVAENPEENVGYRLLVNQYNETLEFTDVDAGVPNRGVVMENGRPVDNNDQTVSTINYVQDITQIAADDFPNSGEAGAPQLAIHHEPGLFLQMLDNFTDDLTIARLASVPHGNSVLALGKLNELDGAATIPEESGLPIGLTPKDQPLDSPYLAPYKHYNDAPFKGVFNPVKPNELLAKANEGVDILRTFEFHFDTNFGTGGINNIPFVKKQADATEMHATFWIQELAEKDANGKNKLRLQYTQTVMLDFFKGENGLIQWPHVSINTLEKVADTNLPI